MTRELIDSASWRARSINTVRLLDFLLIEHMNHAGTENGHLCATHEQLRDYGLSANSIREAIEEAEYLGLLRFTRGGRWGGTNQPSQYRLTFHADRNNNPPTNEWKLKSEEAIQKWMAHRKVLRAAKRKAEAARKS